MHQIARHLKGAAIDTDVFAHQEHAFIGFHGLRQGFLNGGGKTEFADLAHVLNSQLAMSPVVVTPRNRLNPVSGWYLRWQIQMRSWISFSTSACRMPQSRCGWQHRGLQVPFRTSGMGSLAFHVSISSLLR
jgi:hypothetical protein